MDLTTGVAGPACATAVSRTGTLTAVISRPVARGDAGRGAFTGGLVEREQFGQVQCSPARAGLLDLCPAVEPSATTSVSDRVVVAVLLDDGAPVQPSWPPRFGGVVQECLGEGDAAVAQLAQVHRLLDPTNLEQAQP